MLIIAHRGGKAYGPENTIGTIKKSLALNADGAELDIRCSMDNRPVIMHDATVDRTTNGSGEVYRMVQEAVMNLDAGEGNTVPSLIQVLDEFRNTKATFFLELKHPTTALPTAQIVDHYMMKGYTQSRLIIISFYHQLLALVKDKYPRIVTGASLKEIPESLAAAGGYTNSHFILPPIDQLSEDFMADAGKRNLKVMPWVCDEDAQLEKARQLKVYGVITSDPKKALQYE